ncbi:NAD-dependent epimerase/dehydratase [Candidatus Zixiibacteriota bacterium]|nr:NAD-dependent epimerase/dehydratase [candidate division Zixibacteria bacterium]
MSTESKHIILGAGGAIGSVLAEELIRNGKKIKLVSRSGRAFPGTESAAADLTDLTSVQNAVEPNATVYLLAGLPYDHKIWKIQWPLIMRNAVTACGEKSARLLFFDNVYMYGRVDGPMTENTPNYPCSKKGEIRSEIAEYLMSQVKNGKLNALIARAADFYGPYSEKSSVPYFLIFSRLSTGKKAQCLVSARTRHSYTYTGDCGKALYLLANSENTFNQIWHLPTASPPLTGEEFIKLSAEKLGAKPDYQVLKKWMARSLGVFNKAVAESYEMLYQNEFDYVFDSSKFVSRFNIEATPYEKGIAETVRHFKERKLL